MTIFLVQVVIFRTAIPQKVAKIFYPVLLPKTEKQDFICSRSFVELLQFSFSLLYSSLPKENC
jgi:hypothetical protein